MYYVTSGGGMADLSDCMTKSDCEAAKKLGGPFAPSDCSGYPAKCCTTRAECERVAAVDPYNSYDCSKYPVSCGGSSGSTSSSKCAQAGGRCIDTNKFNCSTPTATGKCPGASNVRCCSGSVTAKSTGSPVSPSNVTPAIVYPPAVQESGFPLWTGVALALAGGYMLFHK